jgi:hypothetical protein
VIGSLTSLPETVDRLGGLLDLAEGGSSAAKDDLSVVLNLLIGQGRGYGIIESELSALGVATPRFSAWKDPFVTTTTGISNGQEMSLILGVRAEPGADDSSFEASLDEMANQVIVWWAHADLPPAAAWSLRDLVRKSRNMYGAHVDDKPPRWLAELRYFPAGGADVMSHLFWSYGQAIHRVMVTHLRSLGYNVRTRDEVSYINGIEFRQGLIYQSTDGNLDVRAQIRASDWKDSRRRAILGGLLGDRPFIFGLEPNSTLSMTLGELRQSVRTAYRNSRRHRRVNPTEQLDGVPLREGAGRYAPW